MQIFWCLSSILGIIFLVIIIGASLKIFHFELWTGSNILYLFLTITEYHWDAQMFVDARIVKTPWRTPMRRMTDSDDESDSDMEWSELFVCRIRTRECGFFLYPFPSRRIKFSYWHLPDNNLNTSIFFVWFKDIKHSSLFDKHKSLHLQHSNKAKLKKK